LIVKGNAVTKLESMKVLWQLALIDVAKGIGYDAGLNEWYESLR
jgi:hypothetical protein